MSGGILSLDVASSSGWAYGGPGEVPQHGSFLLPSTGEDLGRYGVEFLQWLTAKLVELQPREVVFEAPILPRQTNLNTTRKLHGLALLVEVACALKGVPCSEIGNSEWRRQFLGPYYPPKACRDELKRAVIAACRNMGWNPRGDDDADALGILHVVSSHRNQARAASDAGNRMGGVE